MKKSKICIGLVVITILVLSVVQVVVANRISTNGIELAKVQNEIKKIKTDNVVLKEKILQRSSFTEIASKAGELGFVKSNKNVYLSTPLPLAKR